MIREILVPTTNQYMLQIPDEMIGKEIEVLAFELIKNPAAGKSESFKSFLDSLDGLRADLSNFTFDRNEANDYE